MVNDYVRIAPDVANLRVNAQINERINANAPKLDTRGLARLAKYDVQRPTVAPFLPSKDRDTALGRNTSDRKQGYEVS